MGTGRCSFFVLLLLALAPRAMSSSQPPTFPPNKINMFDLQLLHANLLVQLVVCILYSHYAAFMVL